MMKPNPKLIKALHKLANRLDWPFFLENKYNWSYPRRCNCGLLAKEIIAVVEKIDIKKADTKLAEYLRQKYYDDWANAAEIGYCAITGMPKWEIFKILSLAGLEKSDYADIEYLGRDKNQPENLSKKIINDYQDLQIISQYMRQKAIALEALLAKQKLNGKSNSTKRRTDKNL